MVTDTVPSPVTPAFMKGILNSCLLVACPHIPSSSTELTHTVLYRNYRSGGTELGSEELSSRSYSKSRTELKRERRCPRVQVTCSHRGRHHCSCSACRGTQIICYFIAINRGNVFPCPKTKKKEIAGSCEGCWASHLSSYHSVPSICKKGHNGLSVTSYRNTLQAACSEHMVTPWNDWLPPGTRRKWL